MNRNEFLLKLDELLELSPGTLSGAEKLSSFENWDSLAVISLIALIDEHFGVVIGSDAILTAKTVNDLVGLTSTSVAA